MSIMTPVLEIGLPELSKEIIEELAMSCENEVTEYLLETLSNKSVEELSVSCILQLTDRLDVELDVMVSQKYSTVDDLDHIIEDAIAHGISWLEKRLLEMKNS